MPEEIVVFGRRYEVTIEGPDADRRYGATIRDAGTGRLLTRNPVRGRSADDARDRALEVTHNLVSIERLQEVIMSVARELAPGADVNLTEDAQAIRADLSGEWELALPFSLPRDNVYDPEFNPDDARERVRAHFAAYLRRSEPREAG